MHAFAPELAAFGFNSSCYNSLTGHRKTGSQQSQRCSDSASHIHYPSFREGIVSAGLSCKDEPQDDGNRQRGSANLPIDNITDIVTRGSRPSIAAHVVLYATGRLELYGQVP